MNTTTYKFGVLFTGDAKGLARAAKEAQAATKMVGDRAMSDYKRMAKARETLGVRAERDIQREIYRTEGAYNRLARSGTMSFNEQRIAARKMREEVTRLNNEMGRLTTRQKVLNGGRAAFAVGAGVGVTTAVVAPRVKSFLDYDSRMSRLANTAYSDRDDTGWRSGKKYISDMIAESVRYGGGSRDQATSAAETLFAAGGVKPEEIRKMLKESMRAATATGADPNDLAELAIKARGSMGITAADRVFGIGAYGGKQGSFEIKDMARHLPAQMGFAKSVGLYGEQGFSELVALNQAAMMTAGSRDEAGNNVKNLLQKIGADSTNKNFAQMGINLPKQLADGRARGQSALSVVGDVVSQQLSKDKSYQAAQKQIGFSKNDAERAANMRAVAEIAQGTLIAKMFPDQQAFGALVSMINNREQMRAIGQDGVSMADRVIGTDHRRMSEGAGYKVEQAQNEAALAMQSSMDKLSPTIGSLADRTAELVKEYPGFTAATYGATLALSGLAAAAAAAAVIGGGGKMPGGFRLPGGVGGPAGAGSSIGKRALGALGLPVIGAGAAMYGMHSGMGWLESKMYEWMQPTGSRGAGFTDPRRLDRPKSLAERMGSSEGASAAIPRLQQDLKGAIDLRISVAPGLMVDAQTQTNNPRIPFRTDLGRNNTSPGF